jgi:hypothetical protein
MPLLQIPVAEKTIPITFTIYLTPTGTPNNWFYTSTDSSVGTDLTRSTGYSFNSQYTLGDKDYDSLGSDGTTNVTVSSFATIHFVFFALAFGYDPAKILNIYSMPVSLGSVVDYVLPNISQ